MMKKKLLAILIIVCLVMSTAVTVFAKDKPGAVNLTVGTELVGSNEENWSEVDGSWQYTGSGYTYIVTGTDSGRLILDGTTLNSYYAFEYDGTEEGALSYEAPGIISLNFVKLNGATQPTMLKTLDIDVKKSTQLNLKNHTSNKRNSYDQGDNSSRVYGIYAYTYDYDHAIHSKITITGEELTFISNEELIVEDAAGIFGSELTIGTNDATASVVVKDIEATNMGPAVSDTSSIRGIASGKMNIGEKSFLKIEDLTVSAKLGGIDGIDCTELNVSENALLEIGNLSTTTRPTAVTTSDNETIGIKSSGELFNQGTILIGQEDKKLTMTFSDESNEYSDVICGAIGIKCDGIIGNYGKIYMDNIVCNFTTNAFDASPNQMKAFAEGIFSRSIIKNFAGAQMNVNMQDKMELTVNAPKSDKGSYFSHGIETIGPGCTLIVEDAEVNSKAGKVDVTVSSDPGAGLSAMGIYCTIFEAKGNSKIWAEANTVKFNPEILANEESMAIACRLLDASGSSYIFADASDFNSKQKGEGIEIQDEWYLADDAVIESYGANENAITTGTSTIIELRSGYSPKLEFGPDESDVDVVYTLKGQEYQKNTYAKISNKNTKIPVTGDTKIPVTGDTNNMMLWVVLAIMAAGIATGTILKIKRTDK